MTKLSSPSSCSCADCKGMHFLKCFLVKHDFLLEFRTLSSSTANRRRHQAAQLTPNCQYITAPRRQWRRRTATKPLWPHGATGKWKIEWRPDRYLWIPFVLGKLTSQLKSIVSSWKWSSFKTKHVTYSHSHNSPLTLLPETFARPRHWLTPKSWLFTYTEAEHS